MLKFVHRKHFNKLKSEARIVVYYSLSEIILGLLLIVLVTFFAIFYLKNNLVPYKSEVAKNQFGLKTQIPSTRAK